MATARIPPSFTCFSLASEVGNPLPAGARRTQYRVNEVGVARGAPLGGISAGSELTRLESPGQLALPLAPFVGVTQHVVYTSAGDRRELNRASARESGPCAVLIPITKCDDWWALAQDERQAYLRAGAPGHVEIGLEFAGEIYRRLYHARALPGSAWDFLTYFEFAEHSRERFAALLGRLRDPEQNPEWRFVERECEVWMTKLD